MKMQCGHCRKPDCRLCQLYDSDPQYRAQWDGEPVPPAQLGYGPGTELANILEEIELHGWNNCPCKARAQQMNLWGVDGCREHREEIISWMKEASSHLSWAEKIRTAINLRKIVNVLDPIGSLVDEAINRAAKKLTKEDEPIKFGSFDIHA